MVISQGADQDVGRLTQGSESSFALMDSGTHTLWLSLPTLPPIALRVSRLLMVVMPSREPGKDAVTDWSA